VTLVFSVEGRLDEGLHGAWAIAEAQAVRAYEAWLGSHSGEDYAAYRACAERADAAQDALARHASVTRSRRSASAAG
jgi:hypothetical protein